MSTATVISLTAILVRIALVVAADSPAVLRAPLGCLATAPNGQEVQGSCFDISFAQFSCPILGAGFSTLSTCPSGNYCCYLLSNPNGAVTQFPGQITTPFPPFTFPTQTTLFPGQITTPFPGQFTTLFPGQFTTLFPGQVIPGNNVCGVSLQSRQTFPPRSEAPTSLNLGLGFTTIDDGQGFISPRDVDGGSSRLARILGGTPVTSLTRYCWIAAIYAGSNYVATGAIVNSNWIVTSGNAVKNFRNPASSQLPLTVQLGQVSTSAGSSPGVGQYQVQSVQMYPGFRIQAPGYPVGDVALLQLATAIDFTANPTLCGACLPDSNASVAGERCHAAGYGVTAETATTTDGLLRDVMLPFIPRPVCDLVYRQVLRVPGYTTDVTSICAGGELGKDTCLKDGGAPLSCVSITRPYYIVAGLSSWGNGCGRYGTPSVYTNLASPAILAWIRTTAGQSFPPLVLPSTTIFGS